MFCLVLLSIILAGVHGQHGALALSYSDDNEYSDVVLGGLFPVHTGGCDGPILDLGVQRMEAMAFIINIINNSSDLLPGLTMGYDMRDTCIMENMALEEALHFVTDSSSSVGISGVVGAAVSSISISTASLLRLFHRPQISYASTARYLSDKTRFDYFLRTLPPDLFQARVMMSVVLHNNWSYVVTINSADTYGREGLDAFVEECESVADDTNGTITCCVALRVELEQAATEADYDAVITAMEQPWVRNTSVVVIFGQLVTAEGILRALERSPNHRYLVFIVSDAVGNQLPSRYRSSNWAMISVLPIYYETDEFTDYFTSLSLNATNNPWLGEYWEFFFNCSLTDPARLCNLEEQRISSESGYTQNSKVSFVINAVLAFGHAIESLLKTVCKDVIICPEVVSHGGVLNGQMLLEHIQNVSFVGFSGKEIIKFDSTGDRRGGYTIQNLEYQSNTSEYKFVTIAKWFEPTVVHALTLTEEVLLGLVVMKEIEWNLSPPSALCSERCEGGQYPEPVDDQARCCWTCTECRGGREVSEGDVCIACPTGFSPNADRSHCQSNPLTYLMWSDVSAILLLCMALIGLGLTLGTATVFLVCYKHKIVKASSRELSAVLLVGILLCYVLVFFYIGRPTPVICGFRRFGFGFTFSLCYAALVIRTNRIHRIFNQQKTSIQRPPLISPQSQLFFTGILVLVQVTISCAWLVTSRPDIAYVYKDYSTDITCGYTNYIGLVVSLGYNFVLLIVSAYFAFRTRKIPQNFNEARFINLTLYSVIIVWLGFIPAYLATASLGSEFQTISEVFAIVLNATTTLSCLFGAKVYYIFRKDSEQSEAAASRKQSMMIFPTLPIIIDQTNNLKTSRRTSIINSRCSSIHSDLPQHTTKNDLLAPPAKVSIPTITVDTPPPPSLKLLKVEPMELEIKVKTEDPDTIDDRIELSPDHIKLSPDHIKLSPDHIKLSPETPDHIKPSPDHITYHIDPSPDHIDPIEPSPDSAEPDLDLIELGPREVDPLDLGPIDLPLPDPVDIGEVELEIDAECECGGAKSDVSVTSEGGSEEPGAILVCK